MPSKDELSARVRELEEQNILLQNHLKELELKVGKDFTNAVIPGSVKIEHIDSFIITQLNDGIIVEVSEYFLQQTGYSRNELLGMTIQDLNLYYDLHEKEGIIYSIKEKGFVSARNCSFRSKEGLQLKGQVSVHEFRIKDVPYQYFHILHSEDVKNIYSGDEQQKKSIIQTEERLSTILENVGAFIFIKDTHYRYTYVNTLVCKLLNRSPEEIIGRTDADFFPPESVKEIMKSDQPVIEEGKTVSREEINLTSHNGIPHTYLTIKIPLRDHLGKITGLCGISTDITNRKQAEEALKRSEANLIAVVNNRDEAIWSIDKDFNYITVNEFFANAYELAYGIKLKPGMNVLQILSPELAEFWKPRYDMALEGKRVNFEFTAELQGETHTYKVSLNPILEGGTVTGVSALSVDISDIRHSEERMQKSEEKFSKAFNTSPEAISIASMENGKYIDVNEEFCRILGYNKNEVVGHTSLELKVWLNDTDRDFYIQELTKRGFLRDFEMNFRVKNGEIRLFLLSCEIIDLDGQKCSINFFLDITERKKIENEVRNSEVRFRSLVETFKDIVFITDYNFRMLYANPSLTLTTGFRVEDFQEPRNIHPEDASRVAEDLQQYLQSDEKYSKEIENRFYDAWGRMHWYTTNLAKIEYNGNPALLYIIRDISERKEAELELVAAKEKAEESDRLKTAFLQNMSHEIRTPLNAILGFSGMLYSKFNDKEKLQYYSEIIEQRGHDLLEIIDNILDIAKIESGQIQVLIENCTLEKLFSELQVTFQEYQKKMRKESIHFNVIVPEEYRNFSFQTDQGKLKQIFSNLINNAFKFTHKGRVEFGIKDIIKDKIVFFVSDTGIGIPGNKHKDIFVRFIQGSQDIAISYGGTGIGLSIVHGLINLLNGEIWLESQPGTGTSFYFSIPFRTIEEKLPEKLNSSEDIRTINKVSNILIVEDDYLNMEYLREILTGDAFILFESALAKRAVDIVLNNDIDLVLMDIRMPDITGYEAIRLIKEKKPEVPVIAQTAYATSADRDAALAAGADDYISKPIKKELLFQKMNTWLSRSKLQKK